MDKYSFLSKLFLAAAILLAGIFIGQGLKKFRNGERNVTVRGLAEKEVLADFGFWPVAFTESSNDLADLNAKMDEKYKIISDFLISSGFSKDEISISPPNVTDFRARKYGSPDDNMMVRYLGEGTVSLKTTKVKLLKETSGKTSFLLSKGIVLSNNDYMTRITYSFKGLNEIKPTMIEEANKNAREAADKFAKDSGSRIGKIKTASQGLFSIEDADFNTPEIKRIRVVNTVEYYLE